MNLSSKVFSDSVFSAFRILISTLRGIVVIPLITNLLGASSYGIWTTVLALVALLSSTGGLHLHGSLIRFGSQDQEREQTYSDLLFLSTVFGTLISLFFVSFGFIVDFDALFDGELDNGLLLVIASGLLVLNKIILQINNNLPRAKGNVRMYDMQLLSLKIVEILCLIAVFLLDGTVVFGIIILSGIYLLFNIIIFAYANYAYEIPFPKISNTRKYLCYSGPMVPKELSTSLFRNADKYLILYFMSPAAVGIYAVSRSLSQFLMRFSSVLNPTLYPSISSAWDDGNVEEITQLYTQIFRFFTILAVPAFFGIIFLSHPLLTLISTPGIANQGVALVPILAIGFLSRGYDSALSYILTAAEKTNRIARAFGISVFLNVVLNIILIPTYGILGAAFATSLSQISVTILIYKYTKFEISVPLPWGTFIRCITSAVFMYVTLTILDLGSSMTEIISINPPVGASLYFISLISMGEFSPKEINRIKDRLFVF